MNATQQNSAPGGPGMPPHSIAAITVSPFHYGLNQGPIVLMIKNYRSGLIWRLMRQCPYLVAGLRRAGFTGGWLGAESEEVHP